MKLRKALFIITTLVSVFGCEEAIDIYVGMPFQPKNINSEYTPGLNIFGILKVGPSYDTLNHFFEVQQLLHISDTNELAGINEANITLEQLSGNYIVSTYMLTNYNDGNYTNSEITPDFGEQWTYACTYDTFIVTSHTHIPNMPVLQQGSLVATEKNISFAIQPDTTAFIYEVFYFNKSDYVFERFIPSKYEPTPINLKINFRDIEGSNNLFIFAYDENYEKYITTSNTFYKPNAYRPRFTTVEGGYGCFCSAASIQIEM
jgi:hypothetical protein